MENEGDKKRERIVRIVGLGLDTDDGHVRMTSGEHFGVYLGSEASHEQMQSVCMEIDKRLSESGRQLEDLSREEFIELVSEVG